MTMAWALVLMVALVLVAAVAALVLRNFPAAVAAVSVVALGVAVLFALLRAPDIALAQAALGAGLGGLLLALALRRLGLWRLEAQEEQERDAE
jgi:uncharacterized MnhB-related membrane protein